MTNEKQNICQINVNTGKYFENKCALIFSPVYMHSALYLLFSIKRLQVIWKTIRWKDIKTSSALNSNIFHLLQQTQICKNLADMRPIPLFEMGRHRPVLIMWKYAEFSRWIGPPVTETESGNKSEHTDIHSTECTPVFCSCSYLFPHFSHAARKVIAPVSFSNHRH